jgi:hypothetical protein
MIALNNYLALSSRDAPEFLGEVPSFIRTNGNPVRRSNEVANRRYGR